MQFKIPEIDRKAVEELKEKSLKEIYSDKEFKQFIDSNEIPLRIVQQNISRFLRVIKDRKLCENCPGIDKCKKKMGHLCLSLTYDSDYERIDNSIVVCPKAELREKLKKRYIFSEFNENMLDFTFKEAGLKFGEERKEFIKYSTGYFKEQLISNKNPRGVFLSGDSRKGKTHLAVLLTKLVINYSNKMIAFIDSLNHINQLNNALYNDKDYFEKQMEVLKNIDVLVFDDFGSEFKSDFFRDNIILPLLTYRAAKGLTTIFTSGYTLDEIKTMYSTSRANEVKAKRIYEAIDKLTYKFDFRGLPYPDSI